jgi:hypothetical protein
MRSQFAAVLILSSCLTVAVIVTLVTSERRKLISDHSSLLIALDLSDVNSSMAAEQRTADVFPSRVNASHQLQLPYGKFSGTESWETVRRNQEIRQHLAKEFCRDEKRNRAVRDHYIRHIIHNQRLRFAYCEIGKVASSTWRAILKALLGDDSRSRTSALLHPLRHINANDRHFKFFFVRHPFDRLVSAYVSKFVKPTSYWHELGPHIIRKYRHTSSSLNGSNTPKTLKSTNQVTFTEFVRYIIDVPLSSPRNDFHWYPQTLTCQPCRVKYDFIGHYETLYQDASYVLERLGASNRIKFPGNANSTASRLQQSTARIQKMFSQLTQTELDRLKVLYRFDFQMFGYDPNLSI